MVVVGSAGTALWVVPSTASAAAVDGQSVPLGTVSALLIFAGVPLGVFAVLALLTLRPGASQGAQRYRPGREWTAVPTWFGAEPRAAATMPALPAGSGDRADLHGAGGDGQRRVVEGTVEDGSMAAAGSGPGGASGSW